MTKTLSLALATLAIAVIVFAGFAFAAHPAGAAGYWALNEGAGTTALDSSGHGNNGAISGAVYSGSGAPTPSNSNALTFDGVDDSVQVTDNTELDLTGAMSISGWVKTSISATQVLARKTFAYEIFVFNGHLGALLGDGTTWSGGDIVEGAVNIADGAWHHVAITYDDASNTLKLYVDGVLDVTNAAYPVTLGANGFDLYLGADGIGSAFYLGGDLDEVELYSRVLTAGEIAILSGTSTTIFVDSDGQIGFGSIDCDGVGVGAYSTIQAAVDAASAGDTVQVCAGTYAEPIQQLPACGNEPASICVYKSITLQGDPGAILDGTGLGFGSAIALERPTPLSGVTIKGFEIRDYANDASAFQGGVGSGIIAWNADTTNILITNNNIHDVGWDGVLVGSDDNTIQSGWTISNNTFANVPEIAVELTNVTNSQVSGNTITGPTTITWDTPDAGVGIEIATRNHDAGLTAGTGISVTGNNISGAFPAGSRAGINILARTYNTATAPGVLDGVTIDGNTITGTGTRGISVASEQRLSDATKSVLSNLTIKNNIITNNDIGVRIGFVAGNPGDDGTYTNIVVSDRNAISGNTTKGVENNSATSVDATCNWWGNLNGPGPFGPGSGDTVNGNVNFTTWLTSPDLSGDCNGPLPQVTVKIIKYVEGVHATAGNANSSAFSMLTTFNSLNIGNAVDAPFTLDPAGWGGDPAYEASFANADAGADYATHEVTGGAVVGASCAEGKPFALVGYTTGETLAGAEGATKSLIEPNFTNITSNKFVIVWNDDCAPTLTVVKVVTNDNGGTAVVGDFLLFIDVTPVTSGATTTLASSVQYTVSETSQAGYTGVIGGDCAADGTITLTPGQVATCTITNDDIPPPVTVTIAKYIGNVHATAGNANSSSFPMSATWNAVNIGAGSGSFSLSTVGFNNPNPYEATTADMTSGADYSTNEDLAGSTVGASCAGGKPFALVGYTTGDTLTAAQVGTPTITSPVFTNITTDKFVIVWNEKCATLLTVTKTVVNNNGGTRVVADFPLFIDGFSVTSGSASTTSPGAHTVSETSQAGYIAGVWGGDCAANGTITLAPGEHKTCTITNDDVAPPPANACATPAVAPPGYILVNGVPGNDNREIAPFTMFVGNGGNDRVRATANGNYIICLGSGKDTVTLNSSSGGITIDAGSGDNTITALGTMVGYITAGSGKDRIVLGSGPHTIIAGDGDNVISALGTSGNQTITTGIGNDTITTGGGDDTISAGSGKNTVVAGGGNDTVTALGGKDTIIGGPGIDTCDADGGVNTVIGCEL